MEQNKIEEKKRRLESYLERERTMLSADGIKSYGIGSRNMQRYDTELKDIQNMIKTLEDEIEELEARQCKRYPRRAAGVVPCDW